jgi:hypothetical protein
MTTPATEAGRRLLDLLIASPIVGNDDDFAAIILAIEQAARADLAAQLPGIIRAEAVKLTQDWALDKRETNSHVGFASGLGRRVAATIWEGERE